MSKRSVPFVVVLLTFALGGLAWACDGWQQVERKNQRYKDIDLTAAQQEKINALKKKTVAQFSDDHRAGRCHADHEATVARFVVEADGVLTNVQRMEVRTGARLSQLEHEVHELKSEIRELKGMVRTLLERSK